MTLLISLVLYAIGAVLIRVAFRANRQRRDEMFWRRMEELEGDGVNPETDPEEKVESWTVRAALFALAVLLFFAGTRILL